MSNINRKNG